MTCGMAAGQQKKRLLTPNLQEQYRIKKKQKFNSSDNLLSLKSHINLKWDDSRKRVVPKKDQVGISWSDLAPFVESVRQSRSGLADVMHVPRDIFGLENLTEVLSYEVWATCLTEAERKYLAQFLPSGLGVEQVVQLLLTGENHHFGNPLLEWCASVCSGSLYPDFVIQKEQQFRANRREFYTEINNYHSDMLEVLKKWKERWLSCKDPEMLLRAKPGKQKKGNLQALAEKVAFHKAPQTEDLPQKVTGDSDVADYMSYIKVSRTQHDLFMNMKHSGDGIQPKHLTRVLGDMDNFNVHPYEALMEEEKKRLRDHWFLVSCKGVPASVEARKERKLLMEKLRRSLDLELAERKISIAEKAEKVDYPTEEFAQDDDTENNPSLDMKTEKLQCSTQDVIQGENNDSLDMQDDDVKDINCSNTSIQICRSPDVQDQNLSDTSFRNTSIHDDQSQDGQDEDLKDIDCTDTSAHMHESRDMQDQDLKDLHYTNTSMDGHGNPDVQVQDLEEINYTKTSVHSHNNQDMQDKDLKDVSYSNASINNHQSPDVQSQDFKDISYTNRSIYDHHLENNPSVNSHLEPTHMLVGEQDAGYITMIPTSNSSLISGSSSEQIHGEEVMDLKAPLKLEKETWQVVNNLDSYYCPDNSMFTPSDNPALKLSHLSGGRQASVIDLGRDILGQQAQNSLNSAFRLGNETPLLRSCSNQQQNEQLQALPKDAAMVSSYSLGHINGLKQHSELQPLINTRFPEPVQLPNLFVQQKQILDQRQNGLFMQHFVNKNVYAGPSGVRFPCGNFPIVDPQNFGARATVDRNFNWLPDEHRALDNWSGLESSSSISSISQSLPGGSNSDGSLFSVLSQCNSGSSRMQFGASSSDQQIEMRNVVPAAQNLYGYAQNQQNSTNSNVQSIDPSLTNLQWMSFPNQNPGTPNPMARPFRGPWNR